MTNRSISKSNDLTALDCFETKSCTNTCVMWGHTYSRRRRARDVRRAAERADHAREEEPAASG
jgi:hypothetical protein